MKVDKEAFEYAILKIDDGNIFEIFAVNAAYNEIFPTMLGVNLSYHMPREVSQTVQEKIKEFHDKSPIRVKQILKVLTDRLKSDPSLKNRNSVSLFLDTELKKIQEVSS